jgi:hypothetical protein
MSTSIEIFSKVNEYVEGRINLREMEYWLANRLPIYLLNPDSTAAGLAGAIELGLAEIQAGIRSERSLKRLLLQRHIRGHILMKSYSHETGETDTVSSVSTTETMNWEGGGPVTILE